MGTEFGADAQIGLEPAEQDKEACPDMIQSKRGPRVTVLDVSDPERIVRHREQDRRHARNLQWLQAHWAELPQSRGRYVAVADQKAFVADTAEVAWQWARSEHPDDDGAIVMFVPCEKGWRVYAHRG